MYLETVAARESFACLVFTTLFKPTHQPSKFAASRGNFHYSMKNECSC